MRDFGPGAILTEFTVHIQIKATASPPTEERGRLAYFLRGVARYDRLRAATVSPNLFLVVLFLPADRSEWLLHTEDQLVLKRCAYWVSLRGAPESENASGQTVYIPMEQLFSPDGLTALLARVARQEELRYEG